MVVALCPCCGNVWELAPEGYCTACKEVQEEELRMLEELEEQRVKQAEIERGDSDEGTQE